MPRVCQRCRFLHSSWFEAMTQGSACDRRVVITGVGIVSPIGVGRQPFCDSLSAERTGIREIQSHFRGDVFLPGMVGGEIPDFDEKTARELVPKNQRKMLRVMCRDIQMGSASAMLAVQDSGLDLDAIDHERLGVDFGANLMFSPPPQLTDACWSCRDDAGVFQFEEWGQTGLSNLEPLWLLKYLPNMPACHIAIFVDARGPSNSVTLDEASGNLALAEAMSVIRRGAADMMIVGTTGTRVHQIKALHAALWHDVEPRPEDPSGGCRPFDVNRRGQVVGEGACTFILEEESHARARGATILGTVLGSGSSCVGDVDRGPDIRRAVSNAMRMALRSAGVAPDELGHINAHGLGSPEDDLAEAQAIHEVFGAHGSQVPVTGLKGVLGNSAASCGTLELAASLLGLSAGYIPATVFCDNPDPECNLNIVQKKRTTSNKTFLNVNFTRVGQASAVVVACP